MCGSRREAMKKRWDEITKLQIILREKEMPMFDEDQLFDYLQISPSFESALYELLILKSENTSLQISGMTIADTSDYFKRLAATYRPFNTGSLGGAI